MALLDSLTALFTSWQFWAILLGLTLFAWTLIAKFFKKINLDKSKVMLISIVALFIALGGASMLGVGSMTTPNVAGVTVSSLQTTQNYVVANGSINLTDSGVDKSRMSDFYLNESLVANDAEIESGVFLVRRSGDLKAASCDVRVIKPASYSISDTTYRILVQDVNTGQPQAYVYTGTTTDIAGITEPKEENVLAFAEGVATGYVSFNISIDETGFDPLTQYDYKDIQVDICGYPYTFRVHKADA